MGEEAAMPDNESGTGRHDTGTHGALAREPESHPSDRQHAGRSDDQPDGPSDGAAAHHGLTRLEALDLGTFGASAPFVCDIDDPDCEVPGIAPAATGATDATDATGSLHRDA